MGKRLTSLQYEIHRLDRELETIEPDEEKTLSQKEEKDEKMGNKQESSRKKIQNDFRKSK